MEGGGSGREIEKLNDPFNPRISISLVIFLSDLSLHTDTLDCLS